MSKNIRITHLEETYPGSDIYEIIVYVNDDFYNVEFDNRILLYDKSTIKAQVMDYFSGRSIQEIDIMINE